MSDKTKVRVGYCDGHYWLTEREPDDKSQAGEIFKALPHVEISAEEWRAYKAYEGLATYWHDRCRSLSNEQYALEHPEDDIFPLEPEPVTQYARDNPEPDEDMLCREPVTGTTLIEAASVRVRTLSAAQITALEKLGWTFMMTGPDEWDWIKFDDGKMWSQRTIIARGGDETWKHDLERITA